MEERALAALPEEACGILLGLEEGSRVVVREVLRTDNDRSGDRRRGYSIAPEALLTGHRRARSVGLGIVGFYHSHPSGDARPSAADIDAAWPDTSYVIVAHREGTVREIRSWRLGGCGGLSEEEILYAERPPRVGTEG